ncbi:MAG: alpha/beta hydrolase fold domain-containing protein [Planctomycetota bacterium]
MQSHTDIVFKDTPSGELLLDIHVPDGPGPHPCISWICGGGWKGMNKRGCLGVVGYLVDAGFALLAGNYRVTSQAPWPAQIEDCKAAIRYARAHADEFALDVDRFGVVGDSAGGHLAAMVAVAGPDAGFDVGENLEASSAVSAAVPIYPPTDFPRWDGPLLDEITALLGGRIEEVPETAAAASPITYVTPGAPPHMLIHGDVDKIVPHRQSVLYRDALQAADVEVTLHTVEGVGHQGDVIYPMPEVQSWITDFFQRHMG